MLIARFIFLQLSYATPMPSSFVFLVPVALLISFPSPKSASQAGARILFDMPRRITLIFLSFSPYASFIYYDDVCFTLKFSYTYGAAMIRCERVSVIACHTILLADVNFSYMLMATWSRR